MSEAKKRGRPRKHKDEAEKVQAWRRKQEGRRLDGYIDSSASWRLQRLSKAWNCSMAGAVERLAMEADKKYERILFPETE